MRPNSSTRKRKNFYFLPLFQWDLQSTPFPKIILNTFTRYNPPEITNSNSFESYSAEATDLFASATMLFMMVMKSAPFNSSNYQDPYYSRLCKSEKFQFWKVFQNIYNPSDEFKSETNIFSVVIQLNF